jgi:hypothetical protein
MPNNKILVLAGEQATGKTFFSLGLVKRFLDDHEDACIVWYLSEPAVTKKMLVDRGIDPNRFMFIEPETVLDWETQVLKAIEKYKEEEDKPPVMMCLDSLGALASPKELADALEGKNKKDMTRTQLIRGAFRKIEMKLAKVGIPLIVIIILTLRWVNTFPEKCFRVGYDDLYKLL